MAKRLTKEEKWRKASEDLINKMFEIAGHNVTFDDIKDRKDEWYTDWTMTVAQAEQWREWGMEYLRKNMNQQCNDEIDIIIHLSMVYHLVMKNDIISKIENTQQKIY